MYPMQTNTVTMSSREIAELTGKRHDNVMRDIENMLLELEISLLSFEVGYKDANNQDRKEYRLPRREVEILLTGYSIPLRARVIDRLHELEGQTRIAAPAPRRVGPSGAAIKAMCAFVQLTLDTLPNLSESSRQTLLSKASESLLGSPLVDLPRIEERHYTATEVGDLFGVSRNVIGRLANAHGLKIPGVYGYIQQQQREHVNGQCEQFMYNQKAVAAFEELLKTE